MVLDQFDEKTIQIIDFFLDNPILEYSWEELAELSGVSQAEIEKRWDVLQEHDIVEQAEREGSEGEYWQLNQESDMTEAIFRAIQEERYS